MTTTAETTDQAGRGLTVDTCQGSGAWVPDEYYTGTGASVCRFCLEWARVAKDARGYPLYVTHPSSVPQRQPHAHFGQREGECKCPAGCDCWQPATFPA